VALAAGLWLQPGATAIALIVVLRTTRISRVYRAEAVVGALASVV
jgi:hypothetical protein